MEIKVYRDLMGENEKWANKTRQLLTENSCVMFNLIGGPGCGKTTLLEKMVGQLEEKLRFAVLEGDIETTRDAERLADLKIPVSQLLTGGACHLEAKMVYYALADFDLKKLDAVIVENVGNLVCPAEFDVGEKVKIAVLSVTEGEEKPLKYPLLFREAAALVLTKTDLLPYLNFNKEACLDNVRRINTNLPIFPVSATQETGIKEFVEWLINKIQAK
ncbi:MAG: hydrogenase nickel incorporation protein HypB [Candidatus Ratteibacteria bacterium]|jgi:hydrogenase nickel incorporation protein HypB